MCYVMYMLYFIVLGFAHFFLIGNPLLGESLGNILADYYIYYYYYIIICLGFL